MAKYKVGQKVNGTVIGVSEYGAFIKIDDNYTGLVHISEISTGFIEDVGNVFEKNDQIEAEVIAVDEDKKQLRLSVKYRLQGRTNKNQIIEEVGSGFGILKDNLDNWITEKKHEIDEKQE